MNATRPRHYVSGFTLAVAAPFFRYSSGRDAHVLRVVGGAYGPVLRRNRRSRAAESYGGADRRGGHRATFAASRARHA